MHGFYLGSGSSGYHACTRVLSILAWPSPKPLVSVLCLKLRDSLRRQGEKVGSLPAAASSGAGPTGPGPPTSFPHVSLRSVTHSALYHTALHWDPPQTGDGETSSQAELSAHLCCPPPLTSKNLIEQAFSFPFLRSHPLHTCHAPTESSP